MVHLETGGPFYLASRSPLQDSDCCKISGCMTLLQCNIGGNPQTRLARGAVLRELIEFHDPTFILLTETKRKRKDIPSLPSFGLFSQDPLDGSSGGIALYYKNYLRFRISIVWTSTKNSILWVHLRHHDTLSNDLYICGVYAPNANSSESRKLSFYTELNRSTSQFQNLHGNCILAGDFNARIGRISGDHATNSNMGPFLEFLEDHPPLININTLKTYGHYTFINISNGNRSIIDYLLTDMHASKIQEHRVLGGDLGTSAQTAHKALLTKIMLTLRKERYQRPKKKPKWRGVTEKNFERYYKSLGMELSNLTEEPVNYKSLLAAINRAKTNSLGRMRPRPLSSSKATPAIDHINKALAAALEKHRSNPSKANLLKAQVLERKLREATDTYETKDLLNLIFRLENLYHIQKMRLFYKKLKERTNPHTNPTYVIRNPDTPDNQDLYSTTKQEYLEFWTRFLEKKFACESLQSSDYNKEMSQLFRQMQCNGYSHCSDMDGPLTKSEVGFAIKTLKNLKAAGIDEFTNEDIKLIEDLTPGLIHIWFCKEYGIAKNAQMSFDNAYFTLFRNLGSLAKPRISGCRRITDPSPFYQH